VKRTAAWFLVYLALCAAILAVVAHEVVKHQQDLFDLVSAYILPSEWKTTGHYLVEKFLKSQVREVLINATVGGSLVLLSMLLFPVKERVSSSFETGARLVKEPFRELPLWLQALEELNLFVLYVTAQMCIFWVGYPPDPMRKKVAIGLSYFILFASFGIDFLSPLLQRHGQRYATIFKVLVKHPFTWIGFGAAFTLPSVLVGKWAGRHPELSFETVVRLLFATHAACIAVGALAGTFFAARLLPDAKLTSRPSLPTRFLAWMIVIAAFSINAYAFFTVGRAIHHKSQILKCNYRVDPKSLKLDLPDWKDLFGGPEAQLTLHLDLTIENPTRFDVEVEKNRIDIHHAGTPVAVAQLTPVKVPAGGRTQQRLTLPLRLRPQVLREKGRALLEWTQWAITLHLEVVPGFELPVYLLVAR
jgi:hypothetical protein